MNFDALTPTQKRKIVLSAAETAAIKFVYYDRKEDEELSPHDLKAAIEIGAVTKAEIIAAFGEYINNSL